MLTKYVQLESSLLRAIEEWMCLGGGGRFIFAFSNEILNWKSQDHTLCWRIWWNFRKHVACHHLSARYRWISLLWIISDNIRTINNLVCHWHKSAVRSGQLVVTHQWVTLCDRKNRLNAVIRRLKILKVICCCKANAHAVTYSTKCSCSHWK